ncbi:hypothetical protein NC651_028656 [Populus alba x Populus x berolinensis]|nr:hypothetical protein NC651_028656 [Populus alba x Populus x berolinensis]
MEASAVDVAPCCSDSIGAGQQMRTHGGYWLTKTSKNLIRKNLQFEFPVNERLHCGLPLQRWRESSQACACVLRLFFKATPYSL